jgi:hypothetical protein
MLDNTMRVGSSRLIATFPKTIIHKLGTFRCPLSELFDYFLTLLYTTKECRVFKKIITIVDSDDEILHAIIFGLFLSDYLEDPSNDRSLVITGKSPLKLL